MRQLPRFAACASWTLLFLGFEALSQAQTFTTLYDFTGGSDGGNPQAGVIRDPDGNLYGTTYIGGDQNCGFYGCGVVYKLDTAGTETALHNFTGGSDGAFPHYAAGAGRGGQPLWDNGLRRLR